MSKSNGIIVQYDMMAFKLNELYTSTPSKILYKYIYIYNAKQVQFSTCTCSLLKDTSHSAGFHLV